MTDDLTTKQLMESVAKARSAYVGARAELIKKQKAGEEISGAVDRDLRPLADVYLSEVDRVADHLAQVLVGVQSKADALVSSSELTLGLGAAAAVLLGAWRAWMVTRAITRPIAQAVLAAEAIGGGNLAYENTVGMFKLAEHMLVATPSSLPVRALAARQQRRPAVSHTKPAAVRSTAARRPTSRVAAAPAPALASVKKRPNPSLPPQMMSGSLFDAMKESSRPVVGGWVCGF